jgi:hypothetical protein
MARDEVAQWFEQTGTKRALSRRRNRRLPDQRVGEREAAARRNEKTGSRLAITSGEVDHAGDPQKNALICQPVSQVIQRGPEQSRIGNFYRALAQNRVDVSFVEGHPPADDKDDEPPDLTFYLHVI